MVVLYLGPNTIMPLASILAGIGGLVLIFWQYIRRAVGGILRLIFRKRFAAETWDDNPESKVGD